MATTVRDHDWVACNHNGKSTARCLSTATTCQEPRSSTASIRAMHCSTRSPGVGERDRSRLDENRVRVSRSRIPASLTTRTQTMRARQGAIAKTGLRSLWRRRHINSALSETRTTVAHVRESFGLRERARSLTAGARWYLARNSRRRAGSGRATRSPGGRYALPRGDGRGFAESKKI
jgi:hypothetical protein